MEYLLYNPFADKNGKVKSNDKFYKLYKDTYPNIKELDFTKINFLEFSKSINEDDIVILSGGDGTLNVFANSFKKYPFNAKVLYFASGTGNDFMRDINKEGLIDLIPYIDNLPYAIVNNEKRYYFNNVSFGLDGTVCEMAEKYKLKNKKFSYKKIAATQLLFKYKTCNAKVNVDGVEHEFKNVWLAPTLNGRFVGGGMMLAPNQDRFSDDISLVVIHDSSRLTTAIAFKSIFKGEHLKKYPQYVSVYKGKSIKVEFDRPNAVQLDGEVILNVTSYETKKGE